MTSGTTTRRVGDIAQSGSGWYFTTGSYLQSNTDKGDAAARSPTQVFSLDKMKSAFSLEKQQIIPPSPQNVVTGYGILLLGARSLCGQPSGLSGRR
jgi:hypothetical protein